MWRAGGEAKRSGCDITSGPEPMPCMSGTKRSVDVGFVVVDSPDRRVEQPEVL
jgi:hypothetical protein